MSRYLWLLAAILLLGCDSGGGSEPDTGTELPGEDQVAETDAIEDNVVAPLAVSILSPEEGEFVEAREVGVDLAYEGPAVKALLLIGDSVVAEEAVTSSPLTLSFTADADGPISIVAAVEDAEGNRVSTAPRSFLVETLPPTGSVDSDRMLIVVGNVETPVTVNEVNPYLIKLVDAYECKGVPNCKGAVTELATSETGVTTLSWDSTTQPDGVLWLQLQIIDIAGNLFTSPTVPTLVLNNGEEVPVTYDPSNEIYVPTNYATVEYHTRADTPTKAGIREVVSWLTWDTTDNWRLEFALGEGLCPHRGIQYVAATSATGEIIIELARSELPESIVKLFPVEEQNSEFFPTNTDPLTFGLFFAHVNPMEPADHIEQRLPVTVHYAFLY